MRLVSFCLASAPRVRRVGVELPASGEIVALDDALQRPGLDMKTFLAMEDQGMEAAGKAVASNQHRLKARDCVLKAPILDSEKVICIGMNYVDHCLEQKVPVPNEPVVFSKFASTLCSSGDPVCGDGTEKLDWEVELCIVIGKTCKGVPKERAMEYVAGFTVAHDVSARDWQLERNGGQWLMGKAFDNFSPIGPAIVTVDEIGDPHNLGIRCFVNGQVMQDGTTAQLVHKTDDLIYWIARYITLKPGDLILTGTPPGVGCFRKPPMFLKDGDVVRCEIDKIGFITNPIVKGRAV
jgi:2-keto-4-pentenoate hydratase/2-oxohepta-3-ene-1,7-dioic acid hydratase in catechol pathway